MLAKDFRKVLLFMCNSWTESECNHIFNNENINLNNWQYSLGWHIWNKWCDACEDHHGSLDCITYFILEVLDTKCLQKLIDYSINFNK